MATIYTSKIAPIRGPYLKHAFAKSVLKGEDAWLQQRDIQLAVPSSGGECQSFNLQHVLNNRLREV
jgi:hypothetical protein